jgi:tRNA(Arg) A34 adenosine deaminase TadA
MFANKLSIVNNYLYSEAKNSNCLHQLAAVLLKGNRMVTAPCCNSHRNLNFNNTRLDSLHAEVHALSTYYKDINNLNRKKLTKLDLIVTRINKSGETCNARPCYKCLNFMKIYKIQRVYYSVSPDVIICENVKDMISIQTSSLHKQTMFNKVSSEEHYKTLLQQLFPSEIKQQNLDNFIRHNLSNVLPTYKVIISGNKKRKIVTIFNDKEDMIVQANIL